MHNSITGEMTKKLLTASLKKLMAQKPLNRISVREIVEDCGLNRQTFYYHFEDIYDQVKWMYNQEAITLLARHEGILVWQDGVLQLINYIQENRAVCLCALHSIGHGHLKRFFYTDIYAIIKKTVFYFGQKVQVSQEYGEFLTHFYTVSLAAMIESWLLGDIKQTPEEFIRFVDITLQDQLRGALERSRDSKD